MARSKFVAPWIPTLALTAASLFPFGLGGQTLAGPLTVGHCVAPRHPHGRQLRLHNFRDIILKDGNEGLAALRHPDIAVVLGLSHLFFVDVVGPQVELVFRRLVWVTL